VLEFDSIIKILDCLFDIWGSIGGHALAKGQETIGSGDSGLDFITEQQSLGRGDTPQRQKKMSMSFEMPAVDSVVNGEGRNHA